MSNSLQSSIDKLLQDIQSYHLERREKIVLVFGILFVLFFLLNLLIIDPYLTAKNKLQKSINRQQKELVTITELSQLYNNNKKNTDGIMEQVQARPANFFLFTFLEEKAEIAGITQFVKYMKPSTIQFNKQLNENTVEMRFEKITLEQLATFLEYTESQKYVVFVRRISIQNDSKQTGILNVTVQMVTYNLSA